jgi:biopolymer transport protein ExbB
MNRIRVQCLLVVAGVFWGFPGIVPAAPQAEGTPKTAGADAKNSPEKPNPAESSATARAGESPAANGRRDSGAGQTEPPKSALERGVWDLIRASGTVGLCIIVLSVAALALTLEYLITIRRGALMPHGLAQELHHHITHGQFTDAEQACKRRASFLAYIVLAGLQEVRFGYPAVEKAMEDASTEQATRLFRKVEYLALIANLSPMLGLLGTVYGILLAFKKVAETRGAALATDLADGVYLALVTTVEGLVVAIPALGVYAIFRNRIEQLASEVQLLAEQVFINYKRGRMARRQDQPADSLL